MVGDVDFGEVLLLVFVEWKSKGTELDLGRSVVQDLLFPLLDCLVEFCFWVEVEVEVEVEIEVEVEVEVEVGVDIEVEVEVEVEVENGLFYISPILDCLRSLQLMCPNIH